MELRHLRYFVAVAADLSFRRAATRLRVAQPSLGRQIRDLEEEIGAPLFERDRRHVALTDAGHVLLGEATRLLASADALLHVTREAARGEAGVLRIGNVGSLSASFLPDTLAQFRESSPRVEIEIRELGPKEQRDALLDGSIHIGIHHSQPTGRDPLLAYQAVLLCGAWVVVPARHPLAAARSVPVDALVDEAFLTYRPSHGAGHEDWILRLCRDYGGFVPKTRRKPVDHWNTLFGMVAAKEGITLMPTLSVDQMKPRGWVARRLRVPRDSFEVSAIWKAGPPSPILARYIPFLPSIRLR